MKKGNIVSIFDGIVRIFIVMITCNCVFAGCNSEFVIIAIGTIISCSSLIYSYKNNIVRVGISYFLSIITECLLIGVEIVTGIIGRIVNVIVPVGENNPAPGDGFLLIGYLFGVIIITAIIRILLGIKEFIRWYKG